MIWFSGFSTCFRGLPYHNRQPCPGYEEMVESSLDLKELQAVIMTWLTYWRISRVGKHVRTQGRYWCWWIFFEPNRFFSILVPSPKPKGTYRLLPFWPVLCVVSVDWVEMNRQCSTNCSAAEKMDALQAHASNRIRTCWKSVGFTASL